MTDDIIGSQHGDVVSLESPEFLAWPESLRRGPDRRTVYDRPGAARYATTAHLDSEHSLVSNAQRLAGGGWSRSGPPGCLARAWPTWSTL